MDTIARYNSHDHANYSDIRHFGVANHRNDAAKVLKAENLNAKTPTVSGDFGSGWYHDAAIKDAHDTLAHPYR